jgi:hypothetical protein
MEGVLDILEAEVAGNHSTEARGFEEGGIFSATNIEDEVQVEIVLCPPFTMDQMYHLPNLIAAKYK